MLKSVLLLCSVFTTVGGYKILAFYAFGSKSHLNAFIPVVNELANRGHQVTFLQPYADLKVHSKIKIMLSTDSSKILKDEGSKKLFGDENSVFGLWDLFREFTNGAETVCRSTLTSDSVKSLLRGKQQFDIVIVNYIMNECSLAIAPMLGKYVVYYAAGTFPNFFRSPAPLPYATVPTHFLPLPSKMTFMQRISSSMNYILSDLWYYHHLVPATEKILAEILPDAPSVRSGMNKISLYVINADPVTAVPRPTVPNIIAMSCPHCKTAKPLPKDLETFVASSGNDGFIIFGLGSFAQSMHFPQRMKEAFLNAFGKLKQKVIWKFEDDSLKTPPNVMITNWMPQQDLLGHPKIRLFISHGGLLSLQEATFNAVPLIGIPLFADQPGNIAHMEELGLSGRLELQNITTERVYEEITKIINDPGYSKRMKKYSSILKDHNKGTIQYGADWIEYVARHDGAWHLRDLGQDMSFFKYFLIDIILFVLGIVFVIRVVIFLLFRLVRRKLRRNKVKKS